MKILITGTHFTPAIAVISELKKFKDVSVDYVGRSTTVEGDSTPSVESKLIPLLNVKFIPITTGRLQRTFSIYTIPSLLKIPVGFIHAFFIILSSKPDVILSFGGYVGVPVVFWGWLFSIPIIVHEQTLVSGLANKISSFFADKIAVSFNSPYSFDKRKTILTGNPIRSEIFQTDKKSLPAEYKEVFNYAQKSGLPTILFMGGNQGSHILNEVVEKNLSKLLKICCVIHAAGDNKYSDYERLKQLENKQYLVKRWIGDGYGAILSNTDLVVCRAGINTLSELALMEKPALVIPIPYLYQNEQHKNAKYFEDAGLVKTLPQSQLNGESLLSKLKEMLENLDILKKDAKGAKKRIIPDAAKRIALETMLLVKRN